MEIGFNRKFALSKPVIYADVNVYRYFAYGELKIIDPERFIWAYSGVHFDEMHRGGNSDALAGMSELNAVEIRDVLDENFQTEGNVRIFDYVDPNQRYSEHLDAIKDMQGSGEFFNEYLLRIFGADNFSQLEMTADKLREEIEDLTSCIDDSSKPEIRLNAKDVSLKMKAVINKHLENRMPIDKTRNALGVSSENRKIIEKSSSPIDDIWDLIKPVMGNVDKDVFFGFSPNPAISVFPHSQHGAIGSAHIILNMIGFSPDKGLANRKKIENILSDGRHIGMASFCQGLLSSDALLCDKARAIYQYVGSSTNTLNYKYNPEGTIIDLVTK
jgi:hypothetical protein